MFMNEALLYFCLTLLQELSTRDFKFLTGGILSTITLHAKYLFPTFLPDTKDKHLRVLHADSPPPPFFLGGGGVLQKQCF
jgi:hypothetical protein